MPPKEAELPPAVRNLYEQHVGDRDFEVYVTGDDDRPGDRGDPLGAVDELLDGLGVASPGDELILDEAGSSVGVGKAGQALGEKYVSASHERDVDAAALAEEEARKRSSGPRSSRGKNERDGGFSPSLGAPTTPSPLTSSVSNRDLERKLHAYGRKLDDLESDVERVEAKLDAVLQLLGAGDPDG